MARGWESKAIEDQIQERDSRLRRKDARYESSPVVRARGEQLESLRLSRARTLQQLQRATNKTHREMLERALGALDAEITSLS